MKAFRINPAMFGTWRSSRVAIFREDIARWVKKSLPVVICEGYDREMCYSLC